MNNLLSCVRYNDKTRTFKERIEIQTLKTTLLKEVIMNAMNQLLI